MRASPSLSGDFADKQNRAQKPAIGVESGVSATIISLDRKTQHARELELQRDNCRTAVRNLRSALQEGDAGLANLQAQANEGRRNLNDLRMGMERLQKQALELQPRPDEVEGSVARGCGETEEREYLERLIAVKEAEEQATRINKELQCLW
ncbi:hypothetical protein Q7P37_009822 [Cladosporium fusiforme]